MIAFSFLPGQRPTMRCAGLDAIAVARSTIYADGILGAKLAAIDVTKISPVPLATPTHTPTTPARAWWRLREGNDGRSLRGVLTAQHRSNGGGVVVVDVLEAAEH
jgi:hypothetical protein